MPKKSIILAPSRSGTTALEHCMNGHPEVTTVDNTIKRKYIRNGLAPQYEIYDLMDQVRTAVANTKMSFGMGSVEHCTYDPFPSDEAINELALTFVMRDPIQTTNSWKRYDRQLDLLPLAYNHMLELLERTKDTRAKIMCITYEDFTKDPEAFLKKWCEQIGIKFTPDMLNWKHDLAGRANEEKWSKLHGTLRASTGIKHVKNKILLDENEMKLAKSLMGDYEKFQEIMKNR